MGCAFSSSDKEPEKKPVATGGNQGVKKEVKNKKDLKKEDYMFNGQTDKVLIKEPG